MFFFSSKRRHTRWPRDWSSDVCSSDLDVYDEVAKRIVDLTNEKQAGDPASNEIYTGPVIEQAAFDKISSYIEIGKEEGELLASDEGDDSNVWFILPTVFVNVASDARIMKEEFLGPVFELTRVSSFNK